MAEVKVIIQDNLGGNETLTKKTPTLASASNAQEIATADSKEVSTAKAGVKNLAIATMLAKQSANYITSNVGKWTGNSHNQAIVNNVQDMLGIGMLAVVNPAVAIASTAIRLTTAALDQSWENKEMQASSQRRLARAGFNNVGEAIGYRRNK
jgi:hypothetical protein